MSQATTDVFLSTARATAEMGEGLSTDYVESDPAQRSDAKIAHFLGLFGIVGTGVYYLLKRNDAGTFARDQMKEAFNFHLFAFVSAITLSIAGGVLTALIGPLGLIVSLCSTLLMLCAVVLSIVNAIKAGNGKIARYPARIRVLK